MPYDLVEITAAAIGDDSAVRSGAQDVKITFCRVASVVSWADQGAPDNMAIDMRLKDDPLPQSRHAILHHATAVAIHNADRPSLGQILARCYQVLTVVDKEERP